MKTRHQYKFSFVMPVYNVEHYLEETILSVVNQSIGFAENCEIIIVDDGSPDNSFRIYNKYAKRYPDNIRVIKQDNAGISTARNNGISVANGKYISFLDSDDMISKSTLTKVWDFFEKHENKIDLVSIPLVYFDAKRGNHNLNYKFSHTRVIDINKEPESIQLSGGSVFVKREIFNNNKYRFDADLKYGEDAKLVSEIILKKKAYGVVGGNAIYHYRKRKEATSALSQSVNDPRWYLPVLEKFHRYIFDKCKDSLGFVPEYFQYVIMYDLQWKLKQGDKNVLTNKEQSEFINKYKKLISEIDDAVILAQRNINYEVKLYLLRLKHGSSCEDYITFDSGTYQFDQKPLCNIRTSKPSAEIEFIQKDKNYLQLEGYFNGPSVLGSELYFMASGRKYQITKTPSERRQTELMGQIISQGELFTVKIPLSINSKIEAFCTTPSGPLAIRINTHRYTMLGQSCQKSYRKLNGVLLVKSREYISIKSVSGVKLVFREIAYQMHLLTRLKYQVVKKSYSIFKQEGRVRRTPGMTIFAWTRATISRYKWLLIPAKSILNNLLVLKIRNEYFLHPRRYDNKQIWIISDRINAAGDNGEALFRYLAMNPPANTEVWFTISGKSDDFSRLQKIGKVIDRNSKGYGQLFLHANKIISSHADDFVVNAYGANWKALNDFYAFDFVFLQHGITKDDISGWLNRASKNIKLFVAAAKPEYESLLLPQYGYTSQDVKLTGFPRFDLLENNPKRKLILAPTWRKNLSGETSIKSGTRKTTDYFKRTSYYLFYQKLLQSKELIGALKNADMKCEFYLHPALSAHAGDFVGSDVVDIKSPPYDYRTAFAEGNILVTDYSSVAFDFAYLRKPVVYTQFDRDVFFQGHLYSEGYFSYSNDGFGPVVYDLDSTVREIVEIIKRDSVMPTKYQQRLDRFFAFKDKNNCKRVVKAIQEIDKNTAKGSIV